jgi:hypothetical protein
MLHDQLKPAIQRQCHDLLSSGISLQHNNPQPNVNDRTVKQFQDLKLEGTLSAIFTNLAPEIFISVAPKRYSAWMSIPIM